MDCKKDQSSAHTHKHCLRLSSPPHILHCPAPWCCVLHQPRAQHHPPPNPSLHLSGLSLCSPRRNWDVLLHHRAHAGREPTCTGCPVPIASNPWSLLVVVGTEVSTARLVAAPIIQLQLLVWGEGSTKSWAGKGRRAGPSTVCPEVGWHRDASPLRLGVRAYRDMGTPAGMPSSISPAVPPPAAPDHHTGSEHQHRASWVRRSAAWRHEQTPSLEQGCNQLTGCSGDTRGGYRGRTGDMLGMAVPLASTAAPEARVLLALLQGAGASRQVLAPCLWLLLPPRPRQALQAVVGAHTALQLVQPQPAEI